MKFKYILHVDGHVSAYRLLNELSFGSVILKVKSMHNYNLWFSKEMIKLNENFSNADKAHYIEISENLSNLEKIINWCNKNPNDCIKICNNSINLYNSLIDYIPKYFSNLLNHLSGLYKPLPNDYFSKIYLLNMKRDFDKKNIMTKELKNIGFRNVSKFLFTAINGMDYVNLKLLELSNLEGVKGNHPLVDNLIKYSSEQKEYWSYLNKISEILTNNKLLGNVKDIEIKSIYKKYKDDIKLIKRDDPKVVRKILKPGQIGHYQSFLEIFKDAQKLYSESNNNQPILIFEDDCKFTNNFMFKLCNVLNSLPKNWGIIYLGLHDGYFETIKNIKKTNCTNIDNKSIFESTDNNCDTRGITIQGIDDLNWNLIFDKKPNLKKYLKDKRKFPYKNVSIKEFYELNFPNINKLDDKNINNLPSVYF